MTAGAPAGPSQTTAPLLVVMGVSGAGKTTLGQALAHALGTPFLDADALHTSANVAKMASGAALDDSDRAPWLIAVGSALLGFARAGAGGVIACSALKRRYRNKIFQGAPDARLVYVSIDIDEARRRIGARPGHYMPSVLVESQFDALEPPLVDEQPVVVSGRMDLESAVRSILRELTRPPLPREG